MGRAGSFGNPRGSTIPRLCLGLWGWPAGLSAPLQLTGSCLLLRVPAVSARPKLPLLSRKDPNSSLVALRSITSLHPQRSHFRIRSHSQGTRGKDLVYLFGGDGWTHPRRHVVG